MPATLIFPPMWAIIVHMRHRTWFDHLTNGASGREAAEKAGLPATTLNNQLRNDRLSAESVIALCRAYDVSPLNGQVMLGFLTPQEARIPTVRELVALLSNQELIHALAMRIDEDESAWEGTFDGVISDAEVVHFPESVQLGSYAADSSPDEPMEGDDDYEDGP